MICPDKFTSIDESVLGKATNLLAASRAPIAVLQLRTETIDRIPDVADFIMSLDALYVLGVINFDEDSGTIVYAD